MKITRWFRAPALAVLALTMAVAGCATTGGSDDESGEPSASSRILVEVNHTLAREGALIIWLSREGERWAERLGRVIPPGTETFEVSIPDRDHGWVLGAARAINDRRIVLHSRRFTIPDSSSRIIWDLTPNLVRVR